MANERDGFYSIWIKKVDGLHRTILKRYFCIVSLLDDKGEVLHQNITHSFATSFKPNIGVRFILPNFPNAREIRIDIARMHKGAGVRRLKSKYLVLATTTFSLNHVRTCNEENGSEYFEFSQTEQFLLSFTSDKDVPFTENVDENLETIPSLEESCSIYLSIKKLLNLPQNYQLASKFIGAQHTWHAVSNKPGRLFQRGTLDLVFNIPHEFHSYKKVKILVRTDTQFLSFPYRNKVTKKVAKYCGINQEEVKYENPHCTFVLFQHQYPKSVEITLLCSTKKLKKDKKKFRFLLDLHPNQWNLTTHESHDKLGTSVNLNSLDQACDQIPNFDFSISSYVRFWDENNLENHWGKNDSILTEEFYCEYEFAFADNFADRFHAAHPKEILDNVCVLFIRGLMCNYYATYYLENLKRVADLGLLNEEVKIDTNKGCMTNAKTIQTFILAKENEFKEQGKNYKFIIFAHSKGVADLHVALATYPEIRPLLYGIIAMQGVHYGTPSYETFQMGKLQSAVESILKGESEAFLDLSYNIRSKFAEDYPFPHDVPAISLATVFKSDYGPELDNPLFDKAYSVCAKQIRKRTGYESDGLVIQADARVPNSDIILLEEMCHSHVASQFPGAKYTPGPITQTVISLLLRKVEGLSALFTGKIDIIIESADNLAPKDLGNTSDPFVVVLKDNVKLFQTQIIKKTLNPLWNYRASIRFTSMDTILKFNCWDHDLLANDFEGRVKITVGELLSGVEVGSDEYVKKSYTLEPNSIASKKNEEITGTIHFSVRYTTNQFAIRAPSPIVIVQ